MNNTQFTYEVAVKYIDSLWGKPVAVEALWDGDTNGWFLMMFVILKKRFGFFSYHKTYHLGNLALGSDLRVFNGTVPPYPEAKLATEIGEKLKSKYNLAFYFPSPIDPDDDCPSWTEKDKAIQCLDCQKLIIPTESPYLPKDICYNCYLKREQNQRLKDNKRCDVGVSMYLFTNDEINRIGYCTYFEDFDIAPYISEYVTTQKNDEILNIVTLERPMIEDLSKNIEQAIEKQLESYVPPTTEIKSDPSKIIHKLQFKGQKIELMERFNEHHRTIRRLLKSYETAHKALNENAVYKIYFKNGVTHRDDSVLRFIHFVQKGKTTESDIMNRYKEILTHEEVLETLIKLEKHGCLIRNNEKYVITDLGKKIISSD